jgi:hypothetical protein
MLPRTLECTNAFEGRAAQGATAATTFQCLQSCVIAAYTLDPNITRLHSAAQQMVQPFFFEVVAVIRPPRDCRSPTVPPWPMQRCTNGNSTGRSACAGHCRGTVHLQLNTPVTAFQRQSNRQWRYIPSMAQRSPMTLVLPMTRVPRKATNVDIPGGVNPKHPRGTKPQKAQHK